MENKNATLLIDADSLLYKSTVCSKEQDPQGFGFVRDIDEAIAKFDERTHAIINKIWDDYGINVDKFTHFVGGVNNYRNLFSKSYKANRKTKEKPPLLNFLRTYAVKNYGAFVCDGCEADDTVYATWLKLTERGETVIIATPDKDMKQIPNCLIFDYYHTRMTLTETSERDALYTKYKMLLIGDSGDCVNPIKGIGEKDAEKLLQPITSEFSMLRAVYSKYKEKYRQKARERFLQNSMLVSLKSNVVTCELFNEI